MFQMKKRHFYKASAVVLVCLLTANCGEAVKDKKPKKSEVKEADVKSRLNGRFDNKLFSIPSPVQTAYLIKRLDLPFDASLLNKSENVGKYVTQHQRALNLGIYGADLGIASLYEEKAISMSYLASIQKLTTELDLSAAFDKTFYEKFEKSNGKGDEMITLMTDAFKDADFYLKDRDRKPLTALILTGGWIESLYFACELQKKNDNPEIKKRISEQTRSLLSIVEILTEYNVDKANDNLISQLTDLYNSFTKIKQKYTFDAPETDEANKITTFHHTLEVELDSKLLKEISDQVTAIRNSIINA